MCLAPCQVRGDRDDGECSSLGDCVEKQSELGAAVHKMAPGLGHESSLEVVWYYGTGREVQRNRDSEESATGLLSNVCPHPTLSLSFQFLD